ncbi:MAG: hypothetical protein ACRBCK_00155 [Alphaproteobacteria bacterium]
MAYGVESNNLFDKSYDVHARDIMGPEQAPGTNPLDVADLSSYFNKVDQSQQQSFRQNMVGNTPQNTLMSKLMPQNSYNAQAKTSSMARKATSHAADGVDVTRSRQQAEQDVKQEKGRLIGDVKDMKRQADGAQAEAAQDVGVSPRAAAETFGATEPPTKLTAAVTVGVDLATGGGGTMVTGLMQGGTVMAELSKKDRQLSGQQQQAVLDNEMQRLQAGGDNSQASVKFDVPKQNPVKWGNADTDDLKDIHSLTMGNLEQQIPELKRLNRTDDDLSEVRNNHKNMQNRDDVLFDSGSVELASQGLQGVSRFKAASGTQGTFDSVQTAPISLKGSSLAGESDYNIAMGASMGMS